MKKLLLIVAVILAGTVNLRAETGQLRGKVMTTNGAVLVNARIVLNTLDRQPWAQLRSSSTGDFSIYAPLGEYQLEINGGGFGSVTQTVRIVPGINFLTVILERYTGSGPSRGTSTQSADNLSALVLDGPQLRSVSDDPREFAAMLSGFGGTDVIVNGEPGRMPAKDEISEVVIDSDPFSAEFSKPGFARIGVTTRVDKELHGSATFNFRDESMNANRSVPYQSRYVHGVISGPLVASRFLTSLEMERHGEDYGRNAVHAITPTSQILEDVSTGHADQAMNARGQYQISSGHALNLNLGYRSLRLPNIGVGGLTLPERGSNQWLRNWNAQIRDTSFLTPALLSEFRFSARQAETRSKPNRDGVSIDVLDSFYGGGSSARNDSRDTSYQLENLIVWSNRSWTLRGGFQGRFVDDHAFTTSNPLGAFTFGSLADYVAGKPLRFQQVVGGAQANVQQSELGAFLQSEWRINPEISITGGVRYESQTNLQDFNNVDPRFSVAFGVRPSVVIRAGAGVFHQRLESAEITDFRQQDGLAHETTFIVNSPSYPNPFLGPGAVNIIAPTRLAVGVNNLVAPYSENGSVSIEKSFASGLMISASTDFIRGVHDLRVKQSADVRNVIVQYNSAGNLLARNVTLRFRTPDAPLGLMRANVFGDYTFGSSKDDLNSNWARTPLYPRHNLWSGAVLQAPGGLSTSLLLHARSGFDAPAFMNLDATLAKTFTLPVEISSGPGTTLTFFVYAQNVLNHRNIASVITDNTVPWRQLEAGIRLRF